MRLLATCLLGSGILTTVFSSMLFYDNQTLLSSLFELGDLPAYGVLMMGLFSIAAGYILQDEKRRAEGEKASEAVEAADNNKAPSVSNTTASSISQRKHMEVVQNAAQVQAVERPKIHLEIMMRLQLEYGTKPFRGRDAIKVIEDRLNADASSTRFALHWGQTQGKIDKAGPGIYQFVETAPVTISSASLVVNDEFADRKIGDEWAEKFDRCLDCS